MKTIAILGAGKIGRMVAHLLGSCGDYRVRVADLSAKNAKAATAHLKNVEAATVDFADTKSIDRVVGGAAAVISCAPFSCNAKIATRAKAKGAHYLDLTEDVQTTEFTTQLAKDAKTAFIPQCGLAPGFITIAANHLIAGMNPVHEVRLRVGALPRFPSNRMKYNLTWSTDGLVNEYLNPCNALVDGEEVKLPPLENLERLMIDGIEYEAFNTSGGLGSFGATLKSRKARNANYKTLRFPGHAEIIKLLAYDLRLADKRELWKQLFDEAIPTTAQDQVVIFVSAVGDVNGVRTERTYANTVLHKEIDGRPWTAIQITTAAGVCAVADLLLTEKLPQRGFVKQEQVSFDAFIDNRFGRHYAHGAPRTPGAN
jgi:saccharopine dehydrogenase-like NADP-dependent oxidoreductase